MKYRIEKRNGQEEVILDVEISLGELSKAGLREKGDKQVITIPINIKSSKMILVEAIKNVASEKTSEELKEMLDNYAKLYFNEAFGVLSYPIQRDGEKIIGLKDVKTISDLNK